MAIFLKNCRVEQKTYSFLARWHDLPSEVIICSDSWIFCLFISASLSLFHSFTAPFSRPLPSLKNFFIFSFRFAMPGVSLPAAVQDIPPDGVLSQCWCPPTLTHTLAQWVSGILRVPRKEWPVSQLTRVYGIVRVSRNLDPALYQCLVFVEFLSVSDTTIILVFELVESFISAY